MPSMVKQTDEPLHRSEPGRCRCSGSANTGARPHRGAGAMTEGEWLACADLRRMLEFLGERASERKLRLFAVRCAAGVERLMRHRRSRHALRVAGRYADGRTSRLDLDAAREAAEYVARQDEYRAPAAAGDHDELGWLARCVAFAAVCAARSAAAAAWAPDGSGGVRQVLEVVRHAADSLFDEET